MIFLQIFSLIQTIPKFQTPIAEIPAFSNCYVVLAHDDVKGSLLRLNIFGEHWTFTAIPKQVDMLSVTFQLGSQFHL